MDELNEPTTVDSRCILKNMQRSDLMRQDGNEEDSSSDTNEKDQELNKMPLNRKIKQELIDDHEIAESQSKRKRVDRQTDTEMSTENNNKTSVIKERTERIDSVEDIDDTNSLIISNFPESWSFDQIYLFISKTLVGMPVIIEEDDENTKHEIRIIFKSSEHWIAAQDILKDKEIEGHKLQVEIDGPMTDADSDTASQATDTIPSIEHDVWETDPQGLYGLKLEYLKSLNITPPVGKWVHVTNFRCDKSELRDAFELAGSVVACSIINTTNKYAKVMYSHPLEAVQAVSMLHNQVFYGQRLNVVMDKTFNSERVLPKGLLSIGPGLGEDGYGVREIAREYERFLQGKSTTINLSLFKNGNVNGIVIPRNMRHSVLGVDKVQISETNPQVSRTSPQLPRASSPSAPPVMRPGMTRSMTGLFVSNVRPTTQESILFGNTNPGPIFRAPMPRGPGPIASGASMSPGDLYSSGQFPRGYMSGRMQMQFVQNVPGPTPNVPLSAPVQSIAANWPGPYNAGMLTRMLKSSDPNTLKIVNLPPTTSFPSLCAKLSTLAQVTSLEFTTPGCAVVRFASPGDTEKCFQNYRNIQLS